MKRLLPVLLLVSLPVLAEEAKKEDPKAVAAADKLFEFLRAAEVPKEKAQDAADKYEDFREKPSAEREKILQETRSKPAFKGRPALVDMMKALNRMDYGPLVRENISDKLKHQRQESEDLQDKSPKDYEVMLEDHGKRAACIKHCGITKEVDIKAVEPYVFPGLEVHEALKALGAALKAKGMDAQDAAWVADSAHALWAQYYKPKVPTAEDLAGLAPPGSGGGATPPLPRRGNGGRKR